MRSAECLIELFGQNPDDDWEQSARRFTGALLLAESIDVQRRELPMISAILKAFHKAMSSTKR